MAKPGEIIHVGGRECDQIVGPDGHRIKLGLRAPSPGQPMLMSHIGVALPKLLSKDRIRQMVMSQFRTRARDIWGPEFIKDQDGRGACFPAGTLIRMADGSFKPIEKISCLDRVLTAEGNVSTVTQTMVRKHAGEIANVTIDGEATLVCTPEHPVLTQRGYIEAKDLLDTDFAATTCSEDPWAKVSGLHFEQWSGNVFNFEVEGDHSYVAEGIGVHNCQGYASAACVEKARWLSGQDFVALSGDFAYSLVNGGRDRGSQLSEGFMAASRTGYCPEDTPGLVRWEYRKSRMPKAAFDAAARFRGISGYYCDNEQEFATALAYGFVGVVAVHVAGSYSRLDSYGVSRGGNGMGNHAVCVDDLVYDDALGDFKYDSPNSWKRSWGDNGRCFYTFDRHFQRTIKVHKFYVFPTSNQDPEGDNPPSVITL